MLRPRSSSASEPIRSRSRCPAPIETPSDQQCWGQGRWPTPARGGDERSSAIVKRIADGARPCKAPVLGVRAVLRTFAIDVPVVANTPSAIVEQELVTNPALDGRKQDRAGIDF